MVFLCTFGCFPSVFAVIPVSETQDIITKQYFDNEAKARDCASKARKYLDEAKCIKELNSKPMNRFVTQIDEMYNEAVPHFALCVSVYAALDLYKTEISYFEFMSQQWQTLIALLYRYRQPAVLVSSANVEALVEILQKFMIYNSHIEGYVKNLEREKISFEQFMESMGVATASWNQFSVERLDILQEAIRLTVDDLKRSS